MSRVMTRAHIITDLGTNELIASLTFAATALNWHYPISGGTYAFSSHQRAYHRRRWCDPVLGH
jgi:hypothetical protein